MEKRKSSQLPSSPPPTPKEEEKQLIVEQYEELKKLIADNRQFTQQVHDAIVDRLVKAEAATAALASQVATVAPAPRNFPRTKEYTVKPGDTLTKIAKVELGQAGRFTEIATMNYDRYPSLKNNANLIQVGWVLRLPA
jgi:nucleoid-associated protein YgaU